MTACSQGLFFCVKPKPRQGDRHVFARPASLPSGYPQDLAGPGPAPVSYTHLDVYKRQGRRLLPEQVSSAGPDFSRRCPSGRRLFLCPLAGKDGLAMPQKRAAGEGAVTGRAVWGCAWGLRARQSMAEGASRAYGGTFLAGHPCRGGREGRRAGRQQRRPAGDRQALGWRGIEAVTGVCPAALIRR